MFKPNELEAFSMLLDEPMKSLEMRIMEDIVRRIKINGEVTRAADWQINRLIQLGMSKREIKKYIKDSLGMNTQEINHLYRDIIRKGYARDESLYKVKGKPFTPFDENTGLQQLISTVASQTSSELKNITQSLGFAVRQPDGKLKFTKLADYYQQTLDGAMLDIASGAFDYNTVLKGVVSEMTNSGLRSVDYASGWSNRVDVAARRAVMTGMSQLTAKVNEDNACELGTDMFEITWHSGARPTHWWGGKWFTRKQLEEVCGLGTVTGLCGANCYHDYYPVIPGISEPSYTDEELAELNRKDNTPVEYNGKKYTKYEALQRQRSLETTMRAQRQKIKLLQDGGANEEDIINARAKYRVTSAEYARFSKAMDIPQQRERVTIDGLGNIGVGKYKTSSGKATLAKAGGSVKPSGKAVEVDVPTPPTNGGTGKLYEPEKIPGKTVDNSGESGIIKKNTLETSKKDFHSIGTIDVSKYKKVTDKNILTDEVIITDNRIEHIIERRGRQFYDEFHDYFAQIVKDPDYIFKDNKADTAVVSKTFVHKGKTVNIVLRLIVEGDDSNYKNSIITAIGENEKRFAQRLRNNTPVYSKFDKTE